MATKAPDEVIDKSLDEVALSDRAFLCSQEPTTYDEAETTYNLATINLTPADFSKAAGDVSGRKLTLAQKTGTGAADGVANHVCFAVAGAPGTIKFISTLQNFTVQNGVGFTLASKDIWEIQAPS